MKLVPLLAASAVWTCASAEVHKMKLNKIPLSEQFVSWRAGRCDWITDRQQHGQNIDSHVRALGQKYMGVRPPLHEELFRESSVQGDANHDVLLDNFMNAQCTIPSMTP